MITKKCPRCDRTHQKKGTFCSRTCANVRVHSEEDKEKRRKKLLEYHQTPEGAATREKASKFAMALNTGQEYDGVSVEEFDVNIPDIRTLDDYSEFLEGYQKGENW